MKRGDHFFHKHWLNAEKLGQNELLECVVTRVAKGVIYYRPYYGIHDDGTPWLGSPSYFAEDHTEKYVRGIGL